jgi:hypothetical protein
VCLRQRATDESTVRSDTGSGGNHDVIRVGVFFGHDMTFPAGPVMSTSAGLVSHKKLSRCFLAGRRPSFHRPSRWHDGRKGFQSFRSYRLRNRSKRSVKTDQANAARPFLQLQDDTPTLFPRERPCVVDDDDVASLTGSGADDSLLDTTFPKEPCSCITLTDWPGHSRARPREFSAFHSFCGSGCGR